MAKRNVVKLGRRKRKWLDVVVPVEIMRVNPDGSIVTDDEGDPIFDVDERTYKVPLMGSLKSGEMLLFYNADGHETSGLEAINAFHQLLVRYIPKDVVDGLDMEDLDEFFDAWNAASQEADGVTQGE